jgi:hypothetical protein
VSLISQYLLFTPAPQLPQIMSRLIQALGMTSTKQAIDNSWLVTHFNNFLYVAIFNGFICLIIMIATSLFTTPVPTSQIEHLIWKPSVVRIDTGGSTSRHGLGNLIFWWVICMALTAALYGYFAWFQFATRKA